MYLGVYVSCVCWMWMCVSVSGCSNFLVTPLASSDGSTLIGYNADSDTLYGTMGHYPSATHSSDDVVCVEERMRERVRRE